MKYPIIIAAGGTAGHLFPALVLYSALKEHGALLITDPRVAALVPGGVIHQVIDLPRPNAKIKFLWGLLKSFRKIYRSIKNSQIVIGFGGYPSLPPLLLALLMRKKIILHEQNIVMSRVNKLFAPFASHVLSNFPQLKNYHKLIISGVHLLHPEIAKQGRASQDQIIILVFGGSQGAKIFDEVIPPAIFSLGGEFKNKIHIIQQSKDENLASIYSAQGVKATIAGFFSDLPALMCKASLIIARSGAGTINEIMALNLKSILIPLPNSANNHQLYNAQYLAEQGGCTIIEQHDLKTPLLAEAIKNALNAPEVDYKLITDGSKYLVPILNLLH